MIEQQHAYNEREAARYLGVSGAALRLWRSRGEGPRHFRAGERLVRYRRADLDSWIESRLSEPAGRVVGASGTMGTQITA
jgi:predicted DNA-binding transcriptional regulator AlpA